MDFNSTLVLFGALTASALGCVSADGGAVEASWVIRSEGRAVSGCGCAEPAIGKVRFRIVAVSPDNVLGPDWCVGRAACEFPCSRQTGATPFAIPEGRYAISLTALGADGRDLTGEPVMGAPPSGVARVTAAPILRDIVDGQPTQLDAFVIEAGCSPACSSGGGRVCGGG